MSHFLIPGISCVNVTDATPMIIFCHEHSCPKGRQLGQVRSVLITESFKQQSILSAEKQNRMKQKHKSKLEKFRAFEKMHTRKGRSKSVETREEAGRCPQFTGRREREPRATSQLQER